MPWDAPCASDAAPPGPLDWLAWVALACAGIAALAAPGWLLAVAPPCLLTSLTDIECWGCGMTRAVVAAVQGQWAQAWALNPRVYVVLPLLTGIFAAFTMRLARSLLPPGRRR